MNKFYQQQALFRQTAHFKKINIIRITKKRINFTISKKFTSFEYLFISHEHHRFILYLSIIAS